MLSGAVLDPSTLRDLIPDFEARGAPLATPVREDRIYFLTPNAKLRFPFTPPPLINHGNYIISLNKFVKWLAGLVEEEGVDLFTGFAGVEILMDGQRILGVRTGDRGIGKHDERKAGFESGAIPGWHDFRRRRGNLTKELMRRLVLTDPDHPQLFAIGIKELWEVPADRVAAGTVIHTMGYPLRFEEFGGGFIYAMPEGRVSVGFVAGLDYQDPMFDPHVAFNHFKRHPLVRKLLEGGQMVRYGAKALPEGGWFAIPRCYADARPSRRRRAAGVHELHAPQGHPPGDAVGHACGGDGLRRHPRRRHVGGTAAAVRGEDQRRADSARALSCPQRPPGVRTRPARGSCVLCVLARQRRVVVRADASPARQRPDEEAVGSTGFVPAARFLARRPTRSSRTAD
jgi:hypothetical protein